MNRFVTLLMAASVVILMGSCSSKKREATQHTLPHSVMVVTPEVSGGAQDKNFSGVVTERENLSVGFRTPGMISKVYVKEGDRVRQGQLLATLDTKDYQLALDAAKTQYEQTRNEVARLGKLREIDGISANEYEKALSGLEQLRINLQAKQNTMDYTSLRSPVNGLVQRVNFNASEQVSAGLGVVEILDMARTEVEINVPADVFKLRDRFGEAYGVIDGKRYPMTLVKQQPKADANQLFNMHFTINAPVSAGESVDVYFSILGDGTSRDLSVPVHSIIEYDGATCVYVVADDNTVHRREVKLGPIDKDGRAIILGGLSEGEAIVRTGGSVLVDGEKVIIVQKPDNSNVGGLL